MNEESDICILSYPFLIFVWFLLKYKCYYKFTGLVLCNENTYSLIKTPFYVYMLCRHKHFFRSNKKYIYLLEILLFLA